MNRRILILCLVIFFIFINNGTIKADVGFGVSNIFTLDTRTWATLSQVKGGPSILSVEVPQNGVGYIYFSFLSEGDSIYNTDAVTLSLLKSGAQPVTVTGDFPRKGLFRIAIPASALGSDSVTSFTLSSSIQVGSVNYSISTPVISFSAKKISVSFIRTWNVFAGGSAGLSSNAGETGAGTSVAIAKLSVSGEAGGGLTITRNNEGIMTLGRRFEIGVIGEVKVPSVNLVVGDVNVGRKANILPKTLFGANYRFTDSNLLEDEKKLAQTGFLLETMSLTGIGLSPVSGAVLSAIVMAANILCGVTLGCETAQTESFWGSGMEGSAGIGFDLNLSDKNGGKKLGMTLTEEMKSFALQIKFVDRYRDAPAGFAKFLKQDNQTGKAITITQAANSDLSGLSASFQNKLKNKDKILLNSGNLTLFDNRIGSETSYRASMSSSGEIEGVEVEIKGGGEAALFGVNRETYYSTRIEFPKEYSNSISAGNTGLSAMAGGSQNVNLGPNKMRNEALQALDQIMNKRGTVPVRMTTKEIRGQAFQLGFNINIDAAMGTKAGISFGVKGRYYDEFEYPRKITDIYPDYNNYLLSSSDYTSVMEWDDFGQIMQKLFSEALPLIQTEFLNIVSTINKAVETGTQFAMVVVAKTGETIGQIAGLSNKKGTLNVSEYSPNSPRVFQKPFAPPQLRQMYYSTAVLHKKSSLQKGVDFQPVEGLLILISDAISIGFVPDGQTQSIDSLDSPVDLKMVIFDKNLADNGFTISDKDRVKIYYYYSDSLSWVREGGTRNLDTVITSIKRIGSYALGIELTQSVDITKPEIYEKGPGQSVISDNAPEIFMRIRDDRYGSGIDLSKTFIVVNNDTLQTSYDPTVEKVYYKYSGNDTLRCGTYQIKTIVTDFSGNVTTDTYSFTLSSTSVGNRKNVPNGFELFQNYPNPFNPSTTIGYTIPKSEHVEIHIYDIKGTHIRTLHYGYLSAGAYEVQWNGRNKLGEVVSSGTYFYQLKFGNSNIVKKMQFVK